MSKKPTVAILIPCYNEIEGLPKIMPLIKREWYNQLFILDGWSTDGSREWCAEHGYDVILRSKPYLGVWLAYKEAFESNLITSDIIITFSPDGNSVPEFIPQLTDEMVRGNYDMVIASRYLPPATSFDDTKLTKIGNWFLTSLINLWNGYKYTDALVIYRAYKAELATKLGFTNELTWIQKLMANQTPLYGWESSMSIRAAKLPMRISEIPASEPPAYRERRQSTFGHGLILLTQIIHEKWFR